ncbi:hypothetical protein [Paenibacillus sp. N3.4]|uniref:hypothetical protein n=1 Tax=Paenibacillus sp. N3.4 TaxID=2603222 RepID=UPI00164FBF6E|nr:hypothetical protein [Paenibacillus sp. N3.4]
MPNGSSFLIVIGDSDGAIDDLLGSVVVLQADVNNVKLAMDIRTIAFVFLFLISLPPIVIYANHFACIYYKK